MSDGASPAALSDPADWCLSRAATEIREHRLSPLDLMAACIRRIEQWEPSLNAFVKLDAERALEEAQRRTEELAYGPPRSQLHGIPVGVKDVIDVAGFATRAGSKILGDEIAVDDALVVARLRASGAVILGKTTTHEFAFGVMTPPARNPWDVSRSPGGSSGGSAAAVAAGECLSALGTDTGGSVRIPAALCGVSGLKPRPGTVPLTGIVPLMHGLDTCGPVARSAEDLAAVWRVISDGAAAVPSTGTTNLRLGAPGSFSSVLEIDTEVETLVQQAVSVLGELGFSRVELDMPSFHEWDSPRMTPVVVELLVNHKEAGWFPEKAEHYSPETLRALRHAEKVPAETLVRSLRAIEQLERQFTACFEEADLIVLPTTPTAAIPAVQDMAREDTQMPRSRAVMTLSRVTAPINFCNLAAVTVPCGFTADGRPVGMQLVAQDELVALDAARVYQHATDFHLMTPRLRDASGGRGG